MSLVIRRNDVAVTLVAVGLFFAWLGLAQYENVRMHRELHGLADRLLDEWFATENPPVNRDDFDYLAIVDSERAFKLFGRAWGVVHLYIRNKDDKNMETFKGIEYFYQRMGDQWVLLDSAGCSAKEHHIRAFDEFLAKGMDVNERVIDAALGFEFDYEHMLAHLEGRDNEHHHDHAH
ncbi:MAG: hypothetical protein IT365_17740 [Candidatus Hydrogenedentes bacterium]|nr:hypothetical protein [Candidatus Hydrogenedentota bacterium]